MGAGSQEEVRHLREQVEQLILSFNTSNSTPSGTPRAAGAAGKLNLADDASDADSSEPARYDVGLNKSLTAFAATRVQVPRSLLSCRRRCQPAMCSIALEILGRAPLHTTVSPDCPDSLGLPERRRRVRASHAVRVARFRRPPEFERAYGKGAWRPHTLRSQERLAQLQVRSTPRLVAQESRLSVGFARVRKQAWA